MAFQSREEYEAWKRRAAAAAPGTTSVSEAPGPALQAAGDLAVVDDHGMSRDDGTSSDASRRQEVS